MKKGCPAFKTKGERRPDAEGRGRHRRTREGSPIPGREKREREQHADMRLVAQEAKNIPESQARHSKNASEKPISAALIHPLCPKSTFTATTNRTHCGDHRRSTRDYGINGCSVKAKARQNPYSKSNQVRHQAKEIGHKQVRRGIYVWRNKCAVVVAKQGNLCS